ncbi:hypothetical protein B0T14DRAFT_562119 [Immersiella caudata]|uniref:F-box domain-containing protein n=1 Tax=Immersiella caudata TaxID=314043 RepID=A0AA39X2P0_9PEZI|nr:hypothetical protein B0T14DRAFT_562119 [Immersiella caudata]
MASEKRFEAHAKRLQKYRDIISSLDGNREFRELAALLSEKDLRTDIIGNLPPELRVLIAKHLDAADVYTLLNVSRKWREYWLHEDCLRPLAKHFLPNFYEYMRIKGELSSCALDWTGPFIETFHKLYRRQTGRFQSYFEYRWNAPYPLDRDFHHEIDQELQQELYSVLKVSRLDPRRVCRDGIPKPTYNSGRVAWHAPPPAQCIVVDDFTSQRRKVLIPPVTNSELGLLGRLSLGDRLLAMRRHRKIYAWDLQTGELAEFTAPVQPLQVVTSGYKVCLVFDCQAILWDFKGGTKTLDLPHPAREGSQFRRVLFHPLSEDTVFVATEEFAGYAVDFAGNLSISKFKAGHPEWTRDYPPNPNSCRKCQPDFNKRPMDWFPLNIDSYGEYGVRAVSVPAECMHKYTHDSSGDPRGALLIDSFNVCTETFTAASVFLPSVTAVWNGSEMVSHVYGTEIILDLPVQARRQIEDQSSLLMVANNLSSAIRWPPPFYASEKRDIVKGSVLRPKLITPPGTHSTKAVHGMMSNRVSRYKAVCCLITEKNESIHSTVSLDDDFLIHDRSGKLGVWSFHTDLVLPPDGGGPSDEGV